MTIFCNLWLHLLYVQQKGLWSTKKDTVRRYPFPISELKLVND